MTLQICRGSSNVVVAPGCTIIEAASCLLLETFFYQNLQQGALMLQVKGFQPGASQEQEEAFMAATSSCQNLYLSSVLSRVLDAVHTVFAGSSKPLPTAAEIQKYIGSVPGLMSYPYRARCSR